MAQNPQRVGENEGLRAVKTPCLRLSDANPSTTEDYADVICGDGAPSGGYGRPAGVTMMYLRKDAGSVSVTLYMTHNGGTHWTAIASGTLGAGLTAIDGLTPAANKAILFTGASTAVLFDISAAALTILDDASVGAIRTTLGVGTGDSPTFNTVNAALAGNASTATTVPKLISGQATITPGNSQAFSADLGQGSLAAKVVIAGIASAADATATIISAEGVGDGTVRVFSNANATGNVVVSYIVDAR